MTYIHPIRMGFGSYNDLVRMGLEHLPSMRDFLKAEPIQSPCHSEMKREKSESVWEGPGCGFTLTSMRRQVSSMLSFLTHSMGTCTRGGDKSSQCRVSSRRGAESGDVRAETAAEMFMMIIL